MTREERRIRRARRRALRRIIRRDTPSHVHRAKILAAIKATVAAMIDDDDESVWISAADARCRNCPLCSERPCSACLAGGVCDHARCSCDDDSHDDNVDEWEDSDDLDDDGAGDAGSLG